MIFEAVFKRSALLYVCLTFALVQFASCSRPAASGTRWSFTLTQVNGNATLDMDGVTIVFENEEMSGSSSGSARLSGSGNAQVKVGGGDRSLQSNYANGVNTMTFLAHQIEILDEGKTLTIDGTRVDLSEGKKTVTVKDDGSVTIGKN